MELGGLRSQPGAGWGLTSHPSAPSVRWGGGSSVVPAGLRPESDRPGPARPRAPSCHLWFVARCLKTRESGF